ncbi:MAG: efflux transporter outer membrane subunit [Clostridium sp.]|nr:efflux transporter outer membrane subunit [Bacteroides sp.]MCM1198090.1 efflux transporter outer membrane subunit [Clostridium sp.]
MKKLLYLIMCTALVSSCSIYRKYQRPEGLPTDSLYRGNPAVAENDTTSFGSMPWQELFLDGQLQELIAYGLENNRDIQVAMLRVEQAQAGLKAARLAYIPSLSFTPQGAIKSTDGNTVKTYEIPVQASWEVDIFGKLTNAKRSAQAQLLQQKAYRQAVRSQLIASIATGYYSLLMLDEQLNISQSNIDIWKEQIRTLEAKQKIGESNAYAVSQARANFYQLEAAHNVLQRRQREAENSLCTLLGMPSRPISRGTLLEQEFPEQFKTGLPLRLLSNRPDVVQAEMALASAYYSTNMARSAFYPNINLGGSVGWTNALGQAISNPGGLILSAVASLAQPIFQRGQLVSNLRISKAEEEIARLNYRQAILNAGQEVNDALYATESSRKDLESHELQQKELERTVRTAELLYMTSNVTYLEVLTARQSLLNAQLNVASDRFTCLQSIISLYHALGGGEE